MPLAVLGILLAAAVTAVAARKRQPVEELAGAQTVSPAVASAISASIDWLLRDEDPRQAVIAAYRRMEQSLSDAGLPRRAPEAPREYLRRVAAALEVDRRPLDTLTTLFERAKFSQRTIDPAVRGDAMSALRALQEELA